MPERVLVVDDSGFFRRRVVEILQSLSDIQVVGTASNGREAVQMVEKLQPDVITMDYEMPIMDGITAVREIMATHPTPVLMFSSLTYEGARVTFDALEAGAVDFLPKSFEAMSGDASRIQKLLHDRIIAVARSRPRKTSAAVAAPAPAPSPAPATKPSVQPLREVRTPARPQPVVRKPPRQKPVAPVRQEQPQGGAVPAGGSPPVASTETRSSGKTKRREYAVVTIGTSTGGPVALQKIITKLPRNFPRPVVLVQHMPATFTPAFAERLDKLSQIRVKQAEHGEVLYPGVAYIAPGGKQMMLEGSGVQAKVKIIEGDTRLHYKPCVDVTFGSAARSFPGKILGLILTGMGADGREGCRMLKESGSVVWAQDEASSVIYGMPMAVAKAGLADEIYSLDEFSTRLLEGVA